MVEQVIDETGWKKFPDRNLVEIGFFLNMQYVPGWISHKFLRLVQGREINIIYNI